MLMQEEAVFSWKPKLNCVFIEH